MNKQNIQQIIRELFRQAFNSAPDAYSQLDENGLLTDECTTYAQEYGMALYECRNEDEIERDDKAGVTKIDYVEWVMAELGELVSVAKSTLLQTWATEINKDWSAGYNATTTDESLLVAFNSEEVARIDYNNGRYTVTGTDKEAVDQLEYMVNR